MNFGVSVEIIIFLDVWSVEKNILFIRCVANAKNGLLAIAKTLGTGVGVLGGGLTYATFKPCCVKLKNVLEDTYLSNPNYVEKEETIIDIESGIEVECMDIEIDVLEDISED